MRVPSIRRLVSIVVVDRINYTEFILSRIIYLLNIYISNSKHAVNIIKIRHPFLATRCSLYHCVYLQIVFALSSFFKLMFHLLQDKLCLFDCCYIDTRIIHAGSPGRATQYIS